MILIQWLSLAGSLIFLLIVLWSIYRNFLREGYALLWIITTLGLIVISLMPRLLDKIAAVVGIHIPAFVLLPIMLGGVVMILFQQSVVISKHNEKIKKLTEELTLLSAELRNMQKRDNRDCKK